MRILSKFHDYYDGVQGLGQDRSLVYVREQRALADAEAAAYECPWPLRTEAICAKGFTLSFSPFWVAVAGKRYRGMRVRKNADSAISCCAESFFYSLELCRNYAVQLTGVDPFKEDGGNPRHRYVFSWDRGRGTAMQWFADQATTEVHAVMAGRGEIIVADPGLSRKLAPGDPLRRRWCPAPLVLNPRLADYDFFKVLDPYQCFQELSMWVGGVLPGRDAMTAKVSDADRFVEHGFDAKTSFRGTNK